MVRTSGWRVVAAIGTLGIGCLVLPPSVSAGVPLSWARVTALCNG
jgi:hypothetical protein